MTLEDKPRATVSVVIPTRGRPETLARAVRSVLAQTHEDFEIVVVLDGPDPATSRSLTRFRDPRLRVLALDEPHGASAARNHGLRAARGTFVGFLDDDDEWFPEKLERQLDRFEEAGEDVALVYASFRKVSDRTGEVLSTSRPGPLERGFVDFLGSTRFGTSVPLIRRSSLQEVGGFDESLPGTQDRDLWLRLAERFTFDHVPDVLVTHFIHPGQITADLSRKVEARQRILEKYRTQLEAHPPLLARHLWRLGMLCCADGDARQGRRYLRQALRSRPFEVGIQRDLLLSTLMPARYAKVERSEDVVTALY